MLSCCREELLRGGLCCSNSVPGCQQPPCHLNPSASRKGLGKPAFPHVATARHVCKSTGQRLGWQCGDRTFAWGGRATGKFVWGRQSLATRRWAGLAAGSGMPVEWGTPGAGMTLYYRPFSSTVSAGGWRVGTGKPPCHWCHQHELRTQRSLLQGQHPVGVAFGHSQVSSQGRMAQRSSHEVMLKAGCSRVCPSPGKGLPALWPHYVASKPQGGMLEASQPAMPEVFWGRAGS